jgi:sugar lactone lactonase YvrE
MKLYGEIDWHSNNSAVALLDDDSDARRRGKLRGQGLLVEGFRWLEAPAWRRDLCYLLVSDFPANGINRWDPETGLSLFMKPSGYTGSAPFEGREPGSDGLTFDRQGRLTICEHGDGRIRRLDDDGSKTVLADRYQGKRFNSPNAAVYRSNGDLHVTDSRIKLPKAFDDPDKWRADRGVCRLTPEGTPHLLEDGIEAPNGIAFAPDEKTLYLTDVDYDGRDGRLIGKEARAFQTWSIAGFSAANEMLAQPDRVGLFAFDEQPPVLACSSGIVDD